LWKGALWDVIKEEYNREWGELVYGGSKRCTSGVQARGDLRIWVAPVVNFRRWRTQKDPDKVPNRTEKTETKVGV
jgi:hypothetical protein